MKNCLECNYHFTFRDRLKMLIAGNLRCKKCNATYRVKGSIFRAIYFCIIIFSTIFVAPVFIHYKDINLSFLSKVLILIFIQSCFILVYDLIPHKFQKYKKLT